MSAILAPIPRVIFTIIEPFSLLCGFLGPIVSPRSFIADQIIDISHPEDVTSHEIILALQLGNLYLLLAFIGISVLYTTTSSRLVRNYFLALAAGDIGHVAMTYHVLGHQQFLDVKGWTPVIWGNIGFTAFLFFARIAYLTGALGKDKTNLSAADATDKKNT
ncbi:hypothetical protein L228DRAFT_250179 [Xylona heveae TC161]|uniref:DUF7704 domain-containing protein n=1 Tax=Xylona heveae (strain CBS 132557 / TC161) TaxID=1328760 RepID=A0A165AHE9_XYLHT|nr:hypothetical protein L228DRAFT_250179 [Xylona heveae TC161]KZF20479.1 hypothetical protein L228DRAFT_250179 [Xylona heveae TC161]